jgi:hypothetical protein
MNDWTLGPAHDGGGAGVTAPSFGGATIWCACGVGTDVLGPAEEPGPILTTWKDP